MDEMYGESSDEVWRRIEADRKTDRLVSRIARVAWGATLAILLVYAGFVTIEVIRTLKRIGGRWITPQGLDELATVMVPLLAVIGLTSLLIAVLATVGLFFRQRMSSLNEIRLRLAALEDLLSEEHDPGRTDPTG